MKHEITIDLPDDLAEKLTVLSRKRGIDVSDLIKDIVRSYLRQEQKMDILTNKIVQAIRGEICNLVEENRLEYSDIIARYKANLSDLEDNYARLLSENKDLRNKIKSLRRELEDKEAEVERLKNELKMYKGFVEDLRRIRVDISLKQLIYIAICVVVALQVYRIAVPVVLSFFNLIVNAVRHIFFL